MVNNFKVIILKEFLINFPLICLCCFLLFSFIKFQNLKQLIDINYFIIIFLKKNQIIFFLIILINLLI